MITTMLTTALVLLPLVAAAVEWVASSGISERHYSDHNTYVISRPLLRIPVITMELVAVIGLVLGHLCTIGLLMVRPAIMQAFFATFVIAMFVMWLSLRRYRVMAYDAYMQIRPFVGFTRTIRYDAIERLVWSSDKRDLAGNRSIAVYVRGRVASILVGTIDLDQLLLNINRDEVVEQEAAE